MTLKRFVNWTFLSLSICLSAYFLYYMSKNPVVQVVSIIFAIMYELANKYIISAGRTQFKKGGGHIFNALILFLIYGVYICYNVLSGAGFFITEIAVQDRTAAKTEMVEMINRQKLDQLNRSIDTLNRALEVEVETSFRSRSAAITAELREREAERETLLSDIASAPVEKTQERNPFRDLSKALGVSMNRLVSWVFCMIMVGICVILIVTSEDLPDDTSKPSISKSELPEDKLTFARTRNETITDTPIKTMPELSELQIETQNDILPEKLEIINFTEELWGDSSEPIPKELTPLKNIAITDRKTRKYSDYLESIGAIEKGRGVPPRAMWPKEKVIDYIKNHDM